MSPNPNELVLKIEFPLPESSWRPELSLFMLIFTKESEKLLAEIAALPYQEQKRRIADFEQSFYHLDIMRYLATQPDKGFAIIQQWDAILTEGGLIDD